MTSLAENPRQPDGPVLPENEKERDFLDLAKRFFEAYYNYVDHRADKKDPENKASEEKLWDAQLALRGEIDAFDMNDESKVSLLWQVKKDFLQIPKSMYLSEKAMDLINEESGRYEFEVVSYPYDEVKYSAPDWLLNMLVHNDSGKLILCRDEAFRIVGVTVMTELTKEGMIYIDHQRAGKHNPAVGLIMLKYAIDLYRNNKSFSKIILITPLIPRGLGNLGFNLSEDMQEAMFDWNGYECQLGEERS